jgi:hypothetical protein
MEALAEAEVAAFSMSAWNPGLPGAAASAVAAMGIAAGFERQGR